MKRLLRVALAALAAPASAQDWPDDTVRLVVGYPPGGTTDVVARLVAEPLSEVLGTSVVVENRAGAGGTIAASEIARADPDGSNFLFAASPEIAIAPAIGREITYDAREDLEPVSLVCTLPQMLVVNPDVPAETVEELIALAEERPGELNFASYGAGTSNHLVGELFKAETGLDIAHIPYKGSAPAMTDLLGGRVDMMFDTVSASKGHVEAGEIRALAIAAPERSDAMPDMPTMDEAGIAGFEGGSWVGVLAPAGTPDEIVQKMSEALAEVVASEELQQAVQERGLPCDPTTPEDFAAFISSEIDKWTEVAAAAGIEVE